MKIRRLFAVVALVALMLAGACDQVNFTAPTGSVITITAQPPSVAANGFSNITVTGTRDNGAPLPDGTTITFTSELGTITPNPVETKDGVAITRFRAGTRAGTAHVFARSGEATEVSVEIVIGEARPSRLVLVATPTQLPVGGGKVNLKAHVFDESGNPLGGIGVIFQTTTGELESRGRIVKTNDSGLATDVLQTTVAASISAETQNGTGTDTAEITIGEGVPCAFETSPPEGDVVVGQPVTFTDTSGNATGLQFLWDFGDGSTDEGQVVTHTYDVAGSFTVVHTVIDSQGFSSVCTKVINVSLDAPICSFDFSPDAPVEGNNVSFDASNSSDTSGIASFQWNFGDGTAPVTTTSPFINHVFNFPACNAGTTNVQVSLVVTDNTGQTSFCAQQLTFTCN